MARLHRWPVFICYRRVDGAASARRLNEMLAAYRTTTPEGDEIELDPYLDETMPGVADWRSLHRPYLEKARALIVVCTPGARIDEGEQDWVHREIDWWIENRDQAPILIDPLMEGSRFVPVQIAERWPDIQRIAVVETEWARLDGPELAQKVAAVRRQVVGAILPSGAAIYDEELQRERARVDELRQARDVERAAKQRARTMLRVAGGLLLAAVTAGGAAVYSGRQSQKSAAIARASLLDARAAEEFQALRQLVAHRAGRLERRMDLIAQAQGFEPPVPALAAPEPPAPAEEVPQPEADPVQASPETEPEPEPEPSGLSAERQRMRSENLRTEISQIQEEIEGLSKQAAGARARGLQLLATADAAWTRIAERGWDDPGKGRARPVLPLVFSVEVLNAGTGEAILVHYGPLDRPKLILVNTGSLAAYRSLRARLAELSLRDYGGRPVPLELVAIADQDEQKVGGLVKLLEEISEARGKGPPPATIEAIWANIFRYHGGNEGQFRNRIRILAEQQRIPVNRPFGPLLMRPERGQLVHRLEGGMNVVVLGPALAQLAMLHKVRRREAERLGGVVEPFQATPPAPSGGSPLRLLPSRLRIPAGSKCVPSRRSGELAGGKYMDRSAPNLASSILLFEFAGRTFLHTGDSRGDLILDGLAAGGLLDAGGRLHVDLMNIPHSGSRNNVTPDFLRRVYADSYLLTGNGLYNNPSIEVLAALISVRPCEPYTMFFTTRDYDDRPSRRPRAPVETMDEFFAAEERNHPNYRRQFLVPRRGSIFVDLLERLP